MAAPNYGLATTTQAQQFETEEAEAYAARTGRTGNPLAGWSLPPAMAGDFWQLFTLAETFAANTGWRYLLTPQQLVSALSAGMGNADQLSVFQYFARVSGVDQSKQPWAALGMSATQYGQQTKNINDTLYGLTGLADFRSAGLSDIEQQAVFQNWSSSQIEDYILQHPTLSQKYGWLQYGYNYQSFQNYKVQNADTLRSRYGHQYSDQQAISNLGAPLAQFHASGGAFGQAPPASQQLPTGRQSAVR